MLESDVATFWESHPCGDASVGGLVDTYDRDYEAFFTDYDKARYAVELTFRPVWTICRWRGSVCLRSVSGRGRSPSS